MTGSTLELLAAPDDHGRLAALRERGLADPDGLTGLLDEVTELVHTDPGSAEQLARLCQLAAEPAGLHAVVARAGYLRARVLAERGELDAALSLIERSRLGWLRAGDRLQAVRCDLGRMQVLDDLGRHREAAEVGQAMLTALDALDAGDPELLGWLRGATLDNLGAALGFLGEHEQALAAYAKAEETYVALGMPEETARPMANRGIELLELGKARTALEVLRSAATVFADAGDRLWSAKCLGHLAQAHRALGELVEAMRVLESARIILDELGARAEAARIRLANADVLLAAGLHAEAEAEALGVAELTEPAGMDHDTAKARFVCALAQLAAGRLDGAAAGLRVAAELFERVEDRQYRARVRLAEADLAARLGRRDQAASLAADAVATLRAGGWRSPLAGALLRQADLSVHDAATRLLAEAGELVDQLDVPQLGNALALRVARLRRRDGRISEAERLLRGAVERTDSLGEHLPDHVLRTAFRADSEAARDELVDLLLTRGDIEDACLIADAGKSRTLTELITGTVGAPRSWSDGGAGDELLRCLADLGAVYNAMLGLADGSRLPLLRRNADELTRRVNTLRLRQSVSTRTLGPAATGPPRALPVAATLAYQIIGADVVVFVVRDGAVRECRRLPAIMPAVDLQLDRLAAQWARFRMGDGFADRHQAMLLRTTRDILRGLCELLVAPVAAALADLDAELVVVPHRRLHQVPFHALYDEHGPLVERWAITVAPSLAPTLVRSPGGWDGGALVIANPDPLAPAVVAEAAAVADTLPRATVRRDDEASSTALRAGLPGPNLLHLACHGLYHKGNPLFSALRLADRWLTSAEVLDLDLGGALVTLSACESGRHGRDAAEPVGLAWAFLAAGASGVLASQWVVHDEVAPALMTVLYTALAAGASPPEALRRAQLDIAASHPHPYFWAPFSYVAPLTANGRRS